MEHHPPSSRRRLRRTLVAGLLALATMVVGLPGSSPPGAPAGADPGWAALLGPVGTSQIEPIDEDPVTKQGWTYRRYRNLAAPCSISGHQTFVIGTKDTSSPAATRPLWVKMRGGGAGWFDDGAAMPTENLKHEERFVDQMKFDTHGLMERAKAGPEGFRVLIVSMCSHDIYGGMNDVEDPGNDNVTDDGQRRRTTGLVATAAAIAYTTGVFPTDDVVLHGTSAGGVGSFHVAYALQLAGHAPAAVVADSGVLNQAWQEYVADHPLGGSPGCEKATRERGEAVLARIDPRVGDLANEPHLLVRDRRLTVPVAHVWNRNDHNVCGNIVMPCPLPDGSTPLMGAARCNHEPMRRAIASLGPGSRSMNLQVCVEEDDDDPEDDDVPCDRHLVTAGVDLRSSVEPFDHQGAILDWVRLRLTDD